MAEFLQNSYSELGSEVNIGRSTFDGGSFSHKTTMKEGDLVPVYLSEVLPGDTFSLDSSFLVRMSTPIFPVMDNADLDLFFFFVPNRLIWDHYAEFLGENTTAPWVQTQEYEVPQIKFGVGCSTEYPAGSGHITSGNVPGSVMNYFGIPCTTYPDQVYYKGSESNYSDVSFTVSDLPNRAYRLIWNEFFRSEALQYPVPVYKDDSDRFFCYDSDRTRDYGGKPLKVCRFFDYFSSCLPAPQRGDSVKFLGEFAPVIPIEGQDNSQMSNFGYTHFAHETGSAGSHNWSHSGAGNTFKVAINNQANLKGYDPGAVSGNVTAFSPDNLAAVFNSDSVSQLRQAFAVQRWLERSARSGTRIREIIQGFFGVTVNDSRVQVPEYLGGDRFPINMDQVLQTSSTDAVSPQGNTAGYSLTSDTKSCFTKSFVEPGLIIGLAAVRVQHSYPQAVYPYFFKKRKFDYYWPQFAHLSEAPVLKRCFSPTGIPELDKQVFGYLPAWDDYRFRWNQVSGDYSPVAYFDTNGETNVIVEQQSQLAQAWTYSDYYKMLYKLADEEKDYTYIEMPTLSGEWLSEEDVNIGQTLALPEETQFLADFYFKVKATRPLPVNSIPGLIDHY